MDVPAFFAVYDSSLKVTDGFFSAVSPKAGSRMLDFRAEVAERIPADERKISMIIDCNSFARREFSEKVMKNLKLPGSDIWFMTYIETVDDVFDAFNKDAELVFAPYHFIESDEELIDINNVSDSVVPTIFVHRGEAVLRNGKKGDVLRVLEKLVRLGYYRNCVLDAGNSLDAGTWEVVADDYPSTIPYVDYSFDHGLSTVVRPYRI
ncbi:hypothetical protein AUP07_0669 [methanogenic archaeon mixed culture ISO4-G1]|nr:hypothetical protein AUP07_0669 [methanogenic archaeon mixed culture ISO4-G1]